jgi:hypothetical protein
MHTTRINEERKASRALHDDHIARGARKRRNAPIASAAAPAWWQRLLRMQPIRDIHAVYDFLDHVQVDGLPVTVLSWPSTRFHIFWPRLLKKLVPVINHLAMLYALLRAKRDRVIVVREFDNLWFLLVSPAFWLLRSRMVLNVNQNFSCPLGLGAGARALGILTRMGFRFMWLDAAAALPDIRAHYPRLRVCTPLFPVQRRRTASRNAQRGEKFTVGLVGYFREDKGGVAKAVALAHTLSRIPGVQVAAGFWNDAQREQFCADAAPHIATCSTYETADYHRFLDRCHAVVVLAERDAYYYRHSGILMDCIAHGALPICPSYPLLESIITRPEPVGATYGDGEKLRCVVMRVLAQYHRLRGNLAAHASARTPDHVSAALEEMLRPSPAARDRAAAATK